MVSNDITASMLRDAVRRHRYWEDLRFPAAAAGRGAAAPTYDDVDVGYEFAHAPPSNQQLQFIAQIPHQWAIGEDVEVHIHWNLRDDDGAGGEDVKWDIMYRWYQTGDIIPAFGAAVENTIDVSGYLTDEALYTGLADVTPPAGITIVSSILEILLERDTADAADDHPHDVLLKELDIHYPIDALGSWQEDSKWG